MAKSEADNGNLDFDQITATFLDWFTKAEGTRLSPKVQLKDLRSISAGRGAGKFHKVEKQTAC
jgi:hypothetical protein